MTPFSPFSINLPLDALRARRCVRPSTRRNNRLKNVKCSDMWSIHIFLETSSLVEETPVRDERDARRDDDADGSVRGDAKKTARGLEDVREPE